MYVSSGRRYVQMEADVEGIEKTVDVMVECFLSTIYQCQIGLSLVQHFQYGRCLDG
jgi:hypothetical protein